MTRIHSAIGIGLLSVLGLGTAADARAEGVESLTRSQKRAGRAVLECSRDLVQASVVNPEFPGSFVALELMQRARMDIHSTQSLKLEASECQKTLNDYRTGKLLKQDPNYSTFRKKYDDWIQMGLRDALDLAPEGVRRLIGGFHSAIDGGGYITCSLVGPKVAAGLGVVLTADAEAGLCKDVDQRRWLAVGAGIGIGLGGVASVGIQSQEFRPLEGVAATEVQDEIAYYIGVGGGVAFPKGRENPDDISLGLGVGAYVGKSVHGAIRLIPVRSDSDEILGIFLE